jgi:hypothetical protein
MAGFPTKPRFKRTFYNRGANLVVVWCQDRELEHPGMRLFHRADERTYAPTLEVAAEESVDEVVVSMESPRARALVVRWKRMRGQEWGAYRARLVSMELSREGMRHAIVDVPDAAPWRLPSRLLSLSGDGEVCHCVASVPIAEGPAETTMRFAVYRWELRRGVVTRMAELPGVYW